MTEYEEVTCPKCKGKGRLLPPSQGKSTLEPQETFECYRCRGTGAIEPEVFVARTSKDELNELTSGLVPAKKEYVTMTEAMNVAEDAEAELARILGGSESDEREPGDMADRIWGLLFPYIASEDGPDYSEANMEVLCADVLPKVWDLILESE